MKARKLNNNRGVVRYFRDDFKENLWRWKSSKMEKHFNGQNEPWTRSTRVPNPPVPYFGNFREITEKQARRAFSACFKEKEIAVDKGVNF
jgi:hypothetical protein